MAKDKAVLKADIAELHQNIVGFQSLVASLEDQLQDLTSQRTKKREALLEALISDIRRSLDNTQYALDVHREWKKELEKELEEIDG